ncbi:hypothetical protein NPIL_555341 [Nephila pilipes]|uniref:Uncharacterized protein n=1 Tax=Nephila pilipes TaxID=299642 RepID=A0A8X6P790_NEPPI|nr:hypothetical protein NPIL_555341 [Nephila pilipes]
MTPLGTPPFALKPRGTFWKGSKDTGSKGEKEDRILDDCDDDLGMRNEFLISDGRSCEADANRMKNFEE